jgi:outer membrane lipoprotein carrier protein
VAELNDAYVTRTPLAFLAGKGNLKEDFKITTSTVTDDERGVIHRLDLEPNVPRMNLSRLVLEVDEKHYLVVKSDLYDSMDNLISIRFNQILMNPHIPKTFFQFTPPKGVEIINMGEGN